MCVTCMLLCDVVDAERNQKKEKKEKKRKIRGREKERGNMTAT